MDFEFDPSENEDSEGEFVEENEDFDECENGDTKELDVDDETSHLISNLTKLSKYKPKQHKEDIRKIKNKEKRLRREQAKVLIFTDFFHN